MPEIDYVPFTNTLTIRGRPDDFDEVKVKVVGLEEAEDNYGVEEVMPSAGRPSRTSVSPS